MSDNDNASFRKQVNTIKNTSTSVTMDELRQRRENVGLPEEMQVEIRVGVPKQKFGTRIKMTDNSGRPPHRHTAEVDAEGNGKTRRTFDNEPHTHDIAGGLVVEGGVIPHIHELEEA